MARYSGGVSSDLGAHEQTNEWQVWLVATFTNYVNISQNWTPPLSPSRRRVCCAWLTHRIVALIENKTDKLKYGKPSSQGVPYTHTRNIMLRYRNAITNKVNGQCDRVEWAGGSSDFGHSLNSGINAERGLVQAKELWSPCEWVILNWLDDRHRYQALTGASEKKNWNKSNRSIRESQLTKTTATEYMVVIDFVPLSNGWRELRRRWKQKCNLSASICDLTPGRTTFNTDDHHQADMVVF